MHEEFLSYLDLERGYSPLTITSYRSDFRYFLRYLSEANGQAKLTSISRQTIRRYIAWMRGEDLKSSSIARRLNSLRSFWNYLRDSGYTQQDPFLRISVGIILELLGPQLYLGLVIGLLSNIGCY